ncbi:MAG: TonB C-terminal domain-containing protein [Candidatus Melainabacteria bacterium]|nr:TonB C-terminal domain-containing protein [Candidatus Melainabacteria bacterium]
MLRDAIIYTAVLLFQTAWMQTAMAENSFVRMKNAALSKVSAAQQRIAAPVNTAKKTGPATEIRDKWGVFIGVGQFEDPSIAPLKFAFKNTTCLTDVFKNVGIGRFAPDHVIAIANQAARKDSIEQTLTDQWLCKKALPEDLVVIYICTRFVRGEAGRGVMLLASDTRLENAAQDGIPLSGLLSNVKRRLQSKRVIAFLDLSPAVKENDPSASKDGGLNIEAIAKNSCVTILSATRGMQQSQSSSVAPVSSFAQYIVEGMTSGMGTLPLAAVAGYVVESVNRDAASVHGKEQTPLFVAASDSPGITDVPLGVRLKSSIAEKSVQIGHPIDQLTMQRPDIISGTPGRQSRSRTLIAAKLPGNDLDIAQATKAQPETSVEKAPAGAKPQAAANTPPAKTPAKAAAKEASDDDDNDDTPPQNVDMGPYIKEMKRLIQSKWTPPKGMQEKHVVSVFTIRRNGTIEDPTIVESSGTESVDESAMAALKAASPLPKLPAGSPQFIQIRYKFDWNVKPSAGSGNPSASP